MQSRRWHLSGIVVLLVLALPFSASAQSAKASTLAYAPVPFGIGERIIYKVSLSLFGDVGSGSLEVQQMDTTHGFPTYRMRMHLKGAVTFARLNNEYESWLDVQSLISRRFYQNVHEVNYKRKRTLEFFPEERRWQRVDNDESGDMPTDEPLDDLSFLYYVRTLPLEVGETYTLPRYWKDEGNPVTVKVLRRDTVTVPSGRFATIVVQPIIRTRGLFSEGGKAEVHFTDDDRRIPVQIKTNLKVPVIKSVTMQLQSYTPGERVAPPLVLCPRTASAHTLACAR